MSATSGEGCERDRDGASRRCLEGSRRGSGRHGRGAHRPLPRAAARLGGRHHVDRRLPLGRVAGAGDRGPRPQPVPAQRRAQPLRASRSRRRRSPRASPPTASAGDGCSCGRTSSPPAPASRSLLVPSGPVYLAGIAAAGVAYGVMLTATYAYLDAVAPPGGLGRALGVWGTSSILIGTTASLAGGLLADVDWRLLFLVVPAMCAPARVLLPRAAAAHAAAARRAGGRRGAAAPRPRPGGADRRAARGGHGPGHAARLGALRRCGGAARRLGAGRAAEQGALVPRRPVPLPSVRGRRALRALRERRLRGAGDQPQRLPAVREAGLGAARHLRPAALLPDRRAGVVRRGAPTELRARPALRDRPRSTGRRGRVRRPAAARRDLGVLGHPAGVPAHRLRDERGAHRPVAGVRRRGAAGGVRRRHRLQAHRSASSATRWA